MGYMFTIKFNSDDRKIMDYIEELVKADKDDGFIWYDRFDGYVMWDNYERDISKISEKFPNVLITVYQEHEDNELENCYNGEIYINSSLTVQYFKYGRFTEEKPARIIISFDEFNEKDEESLLF
jgi:hypothetical protein